MIVTGSRIFEREAAGIGFSVTTAGQTINSTVGSTGSSSDYITSGLGSITIAAPGSHTLEMRPTSESDNILMNLRSIVLKRVRLYPSENFGWTLI